MIDGGKLPEKTTAGIWITDQGFDRAVLSFTEFEILTDISQIGWKLSRSEAAEP